MPFTEHALKPMRFPAFLLSRPMGAFRVWLCASPGAPVYLAENLPQDSVAQRFRPARVSSQLETLVAVAEHLEEGLHLGEQVVVVGRKDDVGDVPGWRPRLHRQAVPVVEAQWTHGHPFPLIADCDTGDGKRFAAIVGVAL